MTATLKTNVKLKALVIIFIHKLFVLCFRLYAYVLMALDYIFFVYYYVYVNILNDNTSVTANIHKYTGIYLFCFYRLSFWSVLGLIVSVFVLCLVLVLLVPKVSKHVFICFVRLLVHFVAVKFGLRGLCCSSCSLPVQYVLFNWILKNYRLTTVDKIKMYLNGYVTLSYLHLILFTTMHSDNTFSTHLSYFFF